MDLIDFVREIETKYDVKSIKIGDMEIWPFLRGPYRWAYSEKYIFNTKRQRVSLWAKIKKTKNIFYGFCSLFKKYDYFVFSNIEECRLLNNGKYTYRISGELINILGRDNVLVYENPMYVGHFRKEKICIKNIISTDLLLFVSKLIFVGKIGIKNEQILKMIENDYSLHVNYKKRIRNFLQSVKILNIFLRIYKPKKIFIGCYFNQFHQELIYVAHKHNMKIAEMQHGIIRSHGGYHVYADLDKSFFPDYLFAFGDYVKNVFNESNYFIEKDNVLSIGNMYIDYINNEYKPSKETIQVFGDFRRKYKKIVAISSQRTIENKLIDFLKRSTTLDRNILYIFVPRDINKDYSNTNFPENIVILRDLNVYQIIKEADFHSTMYSTCALEAPALGTPNILININNFAKKYYSKTLTNRDVTRFVDTGKEFVDTIRSWRTKTKTEIISLHCNFYKQNHKESLKQALRVIGVNL